MQPLQRPKYKQLNANNSEDLFGFNLRGQRADRD